MLSSIKLKCPDCGAGLKDEVFCSSCDWHPHQAWNRLVNLLPSKLTPQKINEDLIHAEDKEDFLLWRDLLFKKRFYIERLQKYWKQNFLDNGKKSFLELGGGMCYISCVVKSLRPDMAVWATDVSPSYLQKKSSRLENFFDVEIDRYAAIDAENLPFEDESFDVIFIAHSIHHIGNTEKFFREVNRVLTKGGVFFGVDHIAAKWDRYYRRDAENAHRLRGEPMGIHERVIRLAEYEKDLRNAGVVNYSIKHEKNRAVKNFFEMRFKNYYRGVTVAIKFEKN